MLNNAFIPRRLSLLYTLNKVKFIGGLFLIIFQREEPNMKYVILLLQNLTNKVTKVDLASISLNIMMK